MLSLVPTILFTIQAIFLYFDRNLLSLDENSFHIIKSVICVNIIASTIAYIITKKTRKINSEKNTIQALKSNITGKWIFYIYVIAFLIQVIIRKTIPAFTGDSEVFLGYTTWGINPFAGIMTALFLLILGERTTSWLGLTNTKVKNDNNLRLALMLAISFLMLRRDILGFLIFASPILLFQLVYKTTSEMLLKNIISLKTLVNARSLFSLFLVFILFFTGVGQLRGSGSGINRQYWQIVTLYISTPLANSLKIINTNDINYIGITDFFLGFSTVGQSIMNSVGIKPADPPNVDYIIPNYNVRSSLGTYYRTFGKDLYILVIGISSGLLTILELAWKKTYPILFILIIIVINSLVFFHFLGSLTITIVFPIIYAFHKLRIRL